MSSRTTRTTSNKNKVAADAVDAKPAGAKRAKTTTTTSPDKEDKEERQAPGSSGPRPAGNNTMLAATVRLNNGVLMPRVGFGTYKFKESEAAAALRVALGAGYRLVDTAHVYAGGKMEPVVGRAIASASPATSSSSSSSPQASARVFVVTKQWRGFHGYDATRECLAQSLRRLGVETIDLLLMHWPGPGYSAMGRSKEKIAREGISCYFKKGHEDIAALRLETWRAMEDALEAGSCRAIGVSNFAVEHLRKLLAWDRLRHKPAVNQIELHPYLQQRDVVALCRAEGIVVQAYASLGGQDSSAKDWTALGQPPLLEHPAVLAAATAHAVSPASVLLQWALQHGFAVIPKSKTPARIRDNVAALGTYELDAAEMAALDALDLGGMTGRLTWRRDELRNLDFD